MRNRVVITGLGCVTPLGSQVRDVWDRLTAGRSGVGRLTLFDASRFPVQIAAEVKDWSIAEVGEDPLRWRHHPRQTLFAVASGIQAVRSAGLDVRENGHGNGHGHKFDPLRFGVYLGCGETYQDWGQFAQMMADSLDGEAFSTEKFTEQAMRLWRPDTELELELNMPAAHLAARFNAQGPNANCIAACASSSQAIGESAEMIRSGEVDIMLAGGAHSMIHPFGISGFHRLSALSQRNEDPIHAVRPFDRDRDGFVVGEGAAMIVLESLEHAQRRGAEILAELTGYGSAQDAYRVTDAHPEGRGATTCMNLALKDADIKPYEISYVNAHGTGTVLNDKVETLAIKQVFGDDAYRVPISSTKSMLGHFTTAGGAVELLIAIMAIRSGVLPPTINYETADPDCDLDYVPNTARETVCRHVLSNSFGFGGQNVALVVSQFDERRRNLVAKRAA
jgi:3-oxoacyl-[acyl-carrier-protein] synthase II